MNAPPHPPPDADAADRWQLGACVLDLPARLLRDAAGTPVPLRPQAYAVLALLARHAGRLVTKDELLDAVWPGLVVTDGSLAQAVSDVRAALGSAGHALVRTVARRGYLLAGATPLNAAATAPAQRPVLPAPAAALFGRAAELGQLHALLARHRLVTVLGAGGIGKTVLALAAAHGQAQRGDTAVVWVDLAPLADPEHLPGTVARAFGLPAAPDGEPLAPLLRALRPLQALLVLDNAEHLVDAVARLARALLDGTAGLQLLVTSQAALHLDAERRLHLGPLPPPGDRYDGAAREPALALFADRAQAIDPRFELTPGNVAAIARLCRQLDGWPLAIRLAASRVHMLGVSALALHLDDGLQQLRHDGRDTPDRQRTLQAALQWSYGLLAAGEQRLFRQLGCCVGRFGPELAQSLTRQLEGDVAARHLEPLAGLVERSLVALEPGDPPRYRLLESPRAFARAALQTAGEEPAAQQRHAQAVTETMQAAEAAWWSEPDHRWLARWAGELDNVRAALRGSALRAPPLCAALLAASTGLFRLLDLVPELRRQAETLDVAAAEGADAETAARYWLARAQLVHSLSAAASYDAARRAETWARSAARADRRLLYQVLSQQLISSHVPPARAGALLDELHALEVAQWPARLRAQRCMARWVVHNLEACWPQALEAAADGYALAQQAGSLLLPAVFGNAILVALLGCGDPQAAESRGAALAAALQSVPPGAAIPFLGTRARVALECGAPATARQRLAAMLESSRRLEWLHFDVFGDLYLQLALAEDRLEDAALLLGHAEVAVVRAWGVDRPSAARAPARSRLAAALGAERLARLCAEGAALGREEVCALALNRAPPA